MSNLKHLTLSQLRTAEKHCEAYVDKLRDKEVSGMSERALNRIDSRIAGQRERLSWIRRYIEEKRRTERDKEFRGFLADYITDAARRSLRAGKLPIVVPIDLYDATKATYGVNWQRVNMACSAPLPTK